MIRYTLHIVIIILVLTACSGNELNYENKELNSELSSRLAKGVTLFNNNRFNEAEGYFLRTYYDAVSNNNETAVKAALKLYLLYTVKNKPYVAEKWLYRAENISSVKASLSSLIKETKVKAMFAVSKYEEILTYTKSQTKPFYLAYSLLAKQKLNKDYTHQLKTLTKTITSNTNDNPETLALLNYSCAYGYYNITEYSTAVKYFNKAIHYDKLIQNNAGLAMSYYTLGKCYIKLNNTEKAKYNLTIAEALFISLGETNHAEKCTILLSGFN